MMMMMMMMIMPRFGEDFTPAEAELSHHL